jgi:hypothetical protein
MIIIEIEVGVFKNEACLNRRLGLCNSKCLLEEIAYHFALHAQSPDKQVDNTGSKWIVLAFCIGVDSFYFPVIPTIFIYIIGNKRMFRRNTARISQNIIY